MALRILGQARGLLSDVHGRKLRSVLESTMISRTVGKLRRCEKMAAEVRAKAGELTAAWKTSIKRRSERFRAGFTLYMVTIIEIYSVKPT